MENNMKLTPIKIGIILSSMVTALIHLGLVPVLLNDPVYRMIAVIFLLNGLGYLALLAAYLLPQPVFQKYRNLTRWLLIAYAVITILGWLVINRDFSDPLGVGSKVAEVILIILLFLDRPKS